MRTEILRDLQAALLDQLQQAWPALLRTVADGLLAQADKLGGSPAAAVLLDARAAWLAFDAELRQAWFEQLQRLLERGLQTAFRRDKPSFAQAAGHSLSLQALAEVEQELALERQIAQFRSAAGEALNELNARIANLYHQAEGSERENPFRPYVLCGSLALGIDTLHLQDEIGSALKKAANQALAGQVATLYQGLNALLAAHAIPVELPLQIRRQADSAAPAPHAASPALPATLSAQGRHLPRSDLLLRWIQMKTSPDAARQAIAQSEPPHWLDSQLNAGQLLRELFGQRPGGGQTGQAPFTTYAGSTVLASSIAELEQSVAGQADAGDLRNHILEHRARLSSQAREPSERMVVDVVAMLFEFMLHDGKLPSSVRSQLGRLQFQLLKLGLFDPTLFAERQHPARQLFNRIGSVAIALSADDPLSDGLGAAIRHLVEQAVGAPHSDVALFERLLTGLEDYLRRTMQHDDPRMVQAAAALSSAEERSAHYLHAMAAMRAALDGLTLPARLEHFLLATWPLAIERVGRDDAAQARNCRQLVPVLVWSVQPKTSNSERMQMLKRLPELVNLLSRHLAQARLNDAEQQDFLDWLVAAHLEALKEGHARAGASLTELEARFADFMLGSEATGAAPDYPAGLAAGFVAEAAEALEGGLELLDAQFDALALPDADTPRDAALAEALKARVLEQLKTGVLVDIAFGGSARRARLNWISPRAASLLLTIANLDKPAALSVQLFRRLLALGHVRFVESEPLFERAVQALLRNADEMEQWARQG